MYLQLTGIPVVSRATQNLSKRVGNREMKPFLAQKIYLAAGEFEFHFVNAMLSSSVPY